MAKFQCLGWGDQAPSFHAPALDGSSTYAFDTVAGRHVVMLFFGAAKLQWSAQALSVVENNRTLFDDVLACFFGICIDPNDAKAGLIQRKLPGVRYFLDYEHQVSQLFGCSDGEQYMPHWLVLDPRLRVLGRFKITDGEDAMQFLRSSLNEPFAPESWAPVLSVPNVFEPELCRTLIELFDSHGGEESGFMRDVDGKTIRVVDPVHKRRKDVGVHDRALRNAIASRVRTRLNPPIARAFAFQATRMERYVVACYETAAGHFRPHRDNTTKGTAHRQFAVTINLNAEDYDGGDLRFPEFGTRTYRAPTGGAVVFSCSLLHEAMPVTRGKRYAFLPFLYNEAAAELREANNSHLGDGVDPYQARHDASQTKLGPAR